MFEKSIRNYKGAIRVPARPPRLEYSAGVEPATYSFQCCRSTNELTMFIADLVSLPLGGTGWVESNHGALPLSYGTMCFLGAPVGFEPTITALMSLPATSVL